MRPATAYARLCLRLSLTCACATAFALAAGFSHAESQVVNGVGSAPVTAAARLKFNIAVPKFLFLRVGTGSNLTTNATVNQITFTVAAANVGNATPVSGTGGTAGGGTAALVAVSGNNGQITITETNNGVSGLGNGAGNFIDYSQIQTTSSAAGLPAPTLSNSSSNTSLPALSGRITSQSANWTYRYLNTTIPAAGTYGTSANGGRVTYTATMP